MTNFERIHALLLPFEHPLYQHVQKTLRRLAREIGDSPAHLDIGGRRSNYTINVPSRVCITDLPRESEMQQALDLGVTDEIRQKLLRRRSNIETFVYDDMTRTSLPESHFAIVSAIEVLEHVEQDEQFVQNVVRVLKPGGYFLMTTPNGDFIPVPLQDHKRHYRARDLETLLRKYFGQASVEYRVNAGRLFRLGWHRPSLSSPFRSLVGLLAYGLGAILERLGAGGRGPDRKLHLVALCRKSSFSREMPANAIRR